MSGNRVVPMSSKSASPFSASKSHPGNGEIHIKLLPPNIPAFEALSFTYPLKLVASTPHTLSTHRNAPAAEDRSSKPLLIPHDANNGSAHSETEVPIRPANVPLIFMLSYGGGLLPPDSINLSITLEANTRLTLTTQGSTKIFPSSSNSIATHLSAGSPATASQTLAAHLYPSAALLLAPDPVQPFARSHYVQKQTFTLAPSASLCLLDWVIEGRRARGERWVAGSWRGRNEVWRDFPSEPTPSSNGESPTHNAERVLMLRDSIILDSGPQGSGQSSLRAEEMGVFGTIIIAGPLFESLSRFFVSEFGLLPRIGGRKWDDDEEDDMNKLSEEQKKLIVWRHARVKQEVLDHVLWTVADIRTNIVVKFTARELEGAKRWIDAMWRWEGTIATEFGDGGFMCLR